MNMDDLSRDGVLYAVDMTKAILVEGIAFGLGSVFVGPHECEDPEHGRIEPTNIPILAIVVKDVTGEEHVLAIPQESKIASALSNMEIYYHIKNLLEA